MADPFFLVTLTGSAIGITLYLTIRHPKRTDYPLRARRQRAVGIPLALTVAVAGAGAAFLLDAELILQWWRWAILLFGAAMLYTGAVLFAPRLWRVPVALLIAVPLIPAVDTWLALPHAEDYLALPCEAPSLTMRDDGGSYSNGPTLALIRIDPPQGEEGLMAVRVLPGVRLIADSSERVWYSAVTVATSDTIRIAVRLERVLPPLWWFPGSERVSLLTVSTADDTSTMRTEEPRITWFRVPGLFRTVELVIPRRPDQFLQPGVYALEYSCGQTDTQDV
jgi:hypothetical protein